MSPAHFQLGLAYADSGDLTNAENFLLPCETRLRPSIVSA